jgi:WD40 repeat protein
LIIRRVLSFFAVVAACGFALSATCLLAEEAKPATKKVTYVDDIQPIFREHCFSCHNQDEAKSDLDLHNYSMTMRGGAGGEVVFPGDLESSRLWALVSHKETPKMPPEQDKLADAKLSLIKQWILDGALESANSKPKVAKKSSLDIAPSTGSQKPDGPPPMPEGLFRQPYVVTNRGAAITAMAASPWAPLIAIAGQKQILLYNSDTAELLGIVPFPEGIPQVLKFSRNGKLLLCGGGHNGQSGRVVLFDVRTGQRVAEIGDEVDTVLAADISPDLKLVALGGPRKVMRVYSVEDGEMEYESRKHTDWVYAAAFSPDGKYLATSDRSGGLFLWEAETGREYQNLTGHSGGVTDISWRPDSKVLLSASEDGSLKLWEADSGKMLKSWTGDGSGVLSAKFGRNGQIISSGRGKDAKLWDGQGKELRSFKGLTEQAMEVVFTHDDARVLAGDFGGDIRMWKTSDGQQIAQLLQNPPTLETRISNQTAQVTSIESDAKKASAEFEVARKAAEAQNAAAKAASDKLVAITGSIKRLELELASAEQALKTATDAAKPTLDEYLRTKAAVEQAKAKHDKEEDKDRRKTLEAELAKAREVRERADSLNKVAQSFVTAFTKVRNEKADGLKRSKAELPGITAEAEKQAKSKAASDKTLAEKDAAAKAVVKRLTDAKALLEHARAEKVGYDKSRNEQASVAR